MTHLEKKSLKSHNGKTEHYKVSFILLVAQAWLCFYFLMVTRCSLFAFRFIALPNYGSQEGSMEGLLLLARPTLFNSAKMSCKPSPSQALCILRSSEHVSFQLVLGGVHIYKLCEL